MKKTSIKYIVLLVVLGFVPWSTFAMSFFFESDYSVYGLQDEVRVDVFLNSEDSVVNTISGEVFVDTDSFSVVDIIDGNSSVLFWIDKPVFDTQTQSIIFSGITPGGISGHSLFLFSIIMNVEQAEGKASFEMKDGLVLFHDGEGTSQTISSIPKTIFASNDPTFQNKPSVPEDREAPEDFSPVITQDQNLYDNKYVLVFATQDKASGIKRYEVKEGFFGRYITAESPYVLKDQALFKTIFVKAVDNTDNERVAIVHPQEKLFDENFILISSILVIVVFISIVYYGRKYS